MVVSERIWSRPPLFLRSGLLNRQINGASQNNSSYQTESHFSLLIVAASTTYLFTQLKILIRISVVLLQHIQNLSFHLIGFWEKANVHFQFPGRSSKIELVNRGFFKLLLLCPVDF